MTVNFEPVDICNVQTRNTGKISNASSISTLVAPTPVHTSFCEHKSVIYIDSLMSKKFLLTTCVAFGVSSTHGVAARGRIATAIIDAKPHRPTHPINAYAASIMWRGPDRRNSSKATASLDASKEETKRTSPAYMDCSIRILALIADLRSGTAIVLSPSSQIETLIDHPLAFPVHSALL